MRPRKHVHGFVTALALCVACGDSAPTTAPALRSGVTATPLTATQTTEMVASDGSNNGQFGGSVAISGDTAVVGASGQSVGTNFGGGAAYVFVRSGGVWTQQAELAASDSRGAMEFGWSVATDGTFAVIGATSADGIYVGAAYVFVRSGSTWTQQAKLTASDAATGDLFGSAVAISGSTVLVGAAAKAAGRGAAYVYVRSGSTWAQTQKLTANDAADGDDFGQSVALFGNTAIVGADNTTIGPNAGQGAAYAFTQSGAAWTQRSKIVARDGAAGDAFGVSVALSATAALVGAPGKTIGARAFQGAAYVFTTTDGWLHASQQGELAASDGGQRDYFGSGVALSGNTAIVGAKQGFLGPGAAYVFVQTGNAWSQQAKLLASDGFVGDSFGQAVALDGTTPIVGAYQKNVGSRSLQGSAYAFAITGLQGSSCTTASDCATTYVCTNGYCSPPCQKCTTTDPSSCTPLTGTACDDGNGCTRTDVCSNGVCLGSNPLVCTAADACHVVGTCDPTTGVCASPAAPNGAVCNDGNVCTQTDTCQGGACVGSNPVACAPSDLCHSTGVCDPGTGACSNPAAPDGTACDDGNACTVSAACAQGVCVGVNPVTCAAADLCHTTGTCNPTTGLCSAPVAADGTPCPGGSCLGGTCVMSADAAAGDAGGAAEAGVDGGGTLDGGTPLDGGSDAAVGGSSDANAGAGDGGDSDAGDVADSSAVVDAAADDAGDARDAEDFGPDASQTVAQASSGCSCRLAGGGDTHATAGGLALAVAALISAARRRCGRQALRKNLIRCRRRCPSADRDRDG